MNDNKNDYLDEVRKLITGKPSPEYGTSELEKTLGAFHIQQEARKYIGAMFPTPVFYGKRRHIIVRDVKTVQPQDTTDLDTLLLDKNGFCKPFPYKTLAAIPRDKFILWCYRHAIYQYPTCEMIEFLEEQLFSGNNFHYKREDVLEIGAGMGHVGRLLGIKQTDAGSQDTAGMLVYYKLIGQSPTIPPETVERLDAASAIRKYAPKVVIACWVTHRWIPGAGMQAGLEDGVVEEEILAACESYIHFGNWKSHQYKPINTIEHGKVLATNPYYPAGWLITRSSSPEDDLCQCWIGANR